MLHLKARDGDLLLITEPSLLTRYAWHLHVIYCMSRVLLVCPNRPPDVSVCWAHGLLFVPCALLSIVCPLPSCYTIIVSVAPPVSPSLPLFVSPFSLLVSVVLCWSVVSRCVCFHVCLFCGSLPACLFFPFGVVFVYLCFILLIKRLILLHLGPLLTHSDRVQAY